MSIWSYINDFELQNLREANREIQGARDRLAKVTAVKADTEQKLFGREANERRFKELSVARALGENSHEALSPDHETADANTSAIRTRVLIEGLEERRQQYERELESCRRSFDARVRATLQSCMFRAAEAYRERAEDLIASWTELNAAQTFLKIRGPAWIQIFLPAMPGMPGAIESHSRPALFDGKNFPLVDDAGLKAELNSMLVVDDADEGNHLALVNN